MLLIRTEQMFFLFLLIFFLSVHVCINNNNNNNNKETKDNKLTTLEMNPLINTQHKLQISLDWKPIKINASAYLLSVRETQTVAEVNNSS